MVPAINTKTILVVQAIVPGLDQGTVITVSIRLVHGTCMLVNAISTEILWELPVRALVSVQLAATAITQQWPSVVVTALPSINNTGHTNFPV